MIPKFDYVRPASSRELFKELSSEGARIHAGGTDLLGCLRDEVFDVKKVVSLSALQELKGINKAADGGFVIGAMTSLTHLLENKELMALYPTLKQAAEVISTPQLRNQGTVGGNLCQRPRCWYYRGEFNCARKGGDICFAENGENQYHAILGGEGCFIVHPSDLAPALISLGAKVEITGPAGNKTLLLEKFYVLPDEDIENENILKANEVLTKVILPPVKGLKGGYVKVRVRESWDFALASAAVAYTLNSDGAVANVRVVLGGVAPKPWRSPEAEAVIKGNKISEELLRKAAEAALKDAKPLEMNAAKIDMAKGALIEAFNKSSI